MGIKTIEDCRQPTCFPERICLWASGEVPIGVGDQDIAMSGRRRLGRVDLCDPHEMGARGKGRLQWVLCCKAWGEI